MELASAITCGVLVGIIGLLIIAIITWFCIIKPPPVWRDEYMHNHGEGTRKLGSWEIMMVESGDKMLQLANTLIIRSKNQITEEHVWKAVSALLKRHPMLSKIVQNEESDSSGLYFKDMQDPQPDVRVNQSEDWKSVMEDENLDIIDPTKGPLWRVVFLPNAKYNDGEDGTWTPTYPFQCSFVFVFHHAIIDGTSYGRLFGEFSDRLEEAFTDSIPSEIEKMEMLPAIDAFINDMQTNTCLERMFRQAMRILNHMGPIRNFIAKQFCMVPLYVRKNQLEGISNPGIKNKTCIIPIELSAEDTQRILAACKRHNIKAHSCLQTAAVIAYTKLSCGEITEEIIVAAHPTINMRPIIKQSVPSNYCGAYLSLWPVENKVGPGHHFWDIATKANEAIHNCIDGTNTISLFLGMFDCPSLVAAIEKFSSAQPGKRADDLTFTNLGNLSYLTRDDSRSVKITARFGFASQHESGNVFNNNIATINGKLFWTFIYYTHTTSEEIAQRYAKMTIDTLLEAIKS